MEFSFTLYPTAPYFLLVGGLGFFAGRLYSRFVNKTVKKVLETRPTRTTIVAEDEDDELESLFEETKYGPHFEEDREKALEAGRRIGREVVYPCGGGYMTRVKMDKHQAQAKNFRPLYPKEERDIISAFSNIIGKTYSDALTIVQKEGYHLHIIDINGVARPPPTTYDATILCVAIEDDDYDKYQKKLSIIAKIANILHVGTPR